MHDFGCMQGKTVLVTGGLGFIGSNLAIKLVESGASVFLFDAMLPYYGANIANIHEVKDRVHVIRGDIRDARSLKQVITGTDYVFHLAAQVDRQLALEEPLLDLEINIAGTINVLEACRKFSDDAVIVYASSRALIGEPMYLPVDEHHPTNPTDAYGVSKLAGEKYCLAYNRAYGLRTTSLRLSNVYGPRGQLRNSRYGVLNLFVGYTLTDETIPVYGDGLQTRDFVYVDDVVEAFLHAALSDKSIGDYFMVGSGQETVFLDMVRIILSAVGKGNYVHVPFPGGLEKVDVHRFRANISKIRDKLGWMPRTSLVKGISLTVDFYRARLSDYLQ